MSTTKRFLTVALAAAFLTAGSAGAITINDKWAADGTGPELNFYHIWNDLYGDAYTSSQDVFTDWGVDILGGEDLFTLANDEGSFAYRAIYAGNDQAFGHFDPADPGAFTQLGFAPGQNSLLPGDPSGDFDPGYDPFGFYIAAGDGDDPVWYSRSSLHGGSRHLAIFRTPDQGPYDLLLAWEDGSDQDYNDLVVGLDNVDLVDPRIVPEPASITLLGLGLAGFATRRFMSRKKS